MDITDTALKILLRNPVIISKYNAMIVADDKKIDIRVDGHTFITLHNPKFADAKTRRTIKRNLPNETINRTIGIDSIG